MVVKKPVTKVTPKIEEVKVKKVAPNFVGDSDTVEEVFIQPKKRVKVDRKTEVLIMNNTNGKFVYENNRTQTKIVLGKYGDVDYITVEELQRMKNEHRDIIEKFWIRIVNVENEEVELEDVLQFLLIDDLYASVLDVQEVENMLLKEDDDKFEIVFLKLNKEFKNRIIERAVILFQGKRFNNFYKMKLMENYLGNDEFFKEISERNVEE